MLLRVRARGPLSGTIQPPGDKSISHRALMLGALAEGETRIRGLLRGEDVLSTAQCLTHMGVTIQHYGGEHVVFGRGAAGLAAPQYFLNAGNSGTTLRLLMGIIASHPFRATIEGDASLNRRPMDRVAIPLRRMGAQVTGQGDRCLPPVTIQGGELNGISYEMPMASAQVKSAVLLAGLRANGQTIVSEPGPSRDHTERMLRMFGAHVDSGPGYAALAGGQQLVGRQVTVPADFSSAAFFIVGGALLPDSQVTISGVGLNPTRTGLLDVLAQMRANVDARPARQEVPEGELVGDVGVWGRVKLQGCRIDGEIIPRLIDELPILCIAAACAEGQTEIRGAEELRVKESDRITVMASVLGQLGVEVEERPDGMIIQGAPSLRSTRIESRGDHRIAMAAAIAGLVAGEVEVGGAECIATSYPGFADDLRRLGAEVDVVE